MVAVEAWLDGRGELGLENVSSIADNDGKLEHDIFMSATTGEDVAPLVVEGVAADIGVAFFWAIIFIYWLISFTCCVDNAVGNGMAPTVSVKADWFECENADVDAGTVGRTK